MKFLINFIKNLAFLAIIGVVLFIAAPDMMKQVFELYDGLFGPTIIIFLIVVAALPRKRRSRDR